MVENNWFVLIAQRTNTFTLFFLNKINQSIFFVSNGPNLGNRFGFWIDGGKRSQSMDKSTEWLTKQSLAYQSNANRACIASNCRIIIMLMRLLSTVLSHPLWWSYFGLLFLQKRQWQKEKLCVFGQFLEHFSVIWSSFLRTDRSKRNGHCSYSPAFEYTRNSPEFKLAPCAQILSSNRHCCCGWMKNLSRKGQTVIWLFVFLSTLSRNRFIAMELNLIAFIFKYRVERQKDDFNLWLWEYRMNENGAGYHLFTVTCASTTQCYNEHMTQSA